MIAQGGTGHYNAAAEIKMLLSQSESSSGSLLSGHLDKCVLYYAIFRKRFGN